VSSHELQEQLLEIVLDGLDDLYDQRFGWPPHLAGGPQRVEVWLLRLLRTTAAALTGSDWEVQLNSAAATIQGLLSAGEAEETLNDAVLAATRDLRSAIADAL